jgi:hypothetical protein
MLKSISEIFVFAKAIIFSWSQSPAGKTFSRE